ncbi:MarR family winged helix-turn-helix transcriptional regulator [Amycolatopsis azurea]|uniref:MarR family winged helix-turn-helix transcriptional regulator n=1 Tax=Amycolatopsis azurea TaxID=36819 RepID=UPI0038254546
MDEQQLTRDLIDRLFDLHDQVQVALKTLLRELRLTEPQATALWRLGSDDSVTASGLAERLGCDASTITAMIDRLEEQGLARRSQSPVDRRVKLIRLTERGREKRDRIVRYATEHSPFTRLNSHEQLQLHSLLNDAAGPRSVQTNI